ncbi:MAG: HprK-related kinase B [Desulfosalsimonas sp.]|uniref:HprK-related kinase B n=1 Tax=Desulfosalsimonas sp. TaxID=3073848 RepID=UPI003970C2BF
MRIDDLTTEAIAQKIRENLPAPHQMKIRLDDCVMAICASDQKIIGYLRSYFGPFLAKDNASARIHISVHQSPAPEIVHSLTNHMPGSGKTKIKEAFAEITNGRIVKKLQTGMVFVFGSGIHLAAGPCMENINQVINFINNRFIAFKLDQGGLLAHAAGVSLQNKGIGIAGFSGTGKSSLALKIVSLGADFTSNDRLILMKTKNRTHMLGVAKHPRVNPGTLLNNPDLGLILPATEKTRYRQMDTAALWAVDAKYDVRILDVFPERRFLIQSPLNAMVILNWQLSDAPAAIRAVDPARRQDLLPALIKSPGVFYSSENYQVGEVSPQPAYIQALETCEVFEVSGGVDFECAAEYFMQYLRFGAAPLRKAK